MSIPEVLKIAEGPSARKEKLPPTHYEKIVRFLRDKGGISIPADIKPLVEQEGSTFLSDTTLDSFLQQRAPALHNLRSSPSVQARSEYYAMRAAVAHAAAFSQSRRVFRLERGLTQKLLYTSIGKIDARYVRSPFDSIYLTIPHNEELLLPNIRAGERVITGCYLFCREVDATTVKIRERESSSPVDTYIQASDKFGADKLYLIKLLAVSEGAGRPVTDLSDDFLFYGMFFLKDGEDLLRQVAAQAEENCLVKSEAPYMEALMRFLVNALLYMSSPGAAMERVDPKYEVVGKKASDRERAKIKAKNEVVSKLGLISIGKGVSCLQGTSEFYGETPLVARVVGCPAWRVRGHWRAQPYGPGRELRRAQWIEPYDKGKGLLTEETDSGRDYKVGVS